jgi:hypothetical protein
MLSSTALEVPLVSFGFCFEVDLAIALRFLDQDCITLMLFLQFRCRLPSQGLR